MTGMNDITNELEKENLTRKELAKNLNCGAGSISRPLRKLLEDGFIDEVPSDRLINRKLRLTEEYWGLKKKKKEQ